MMKIGIELLSDEIGKSGCISFHRNLIFWLSKNATNDNYIVFIYKKEFDDYNKYIQNNNNICLIDLGKRPALLRRIYDQYFTVPRLYKQYGIIKVFSDNLVPFGNRNIQFIFRAIFVQFLFKEFKYGFFKKLYRKLTFKYSVNKSKTIIANSNYTRKIITKSCKTDEKKVKIIFEAADTTKFFEIDKKENLKKYLEEKYNIDRPYILIVSNLYKHKNIDIGIEILSKIKDENILLIIIGGDPLNNWSDYYELALKRGVAHLVRYLNFIMPDELNKFYNCAICLFYPSISETFGIPPLEAMAAKIPVIGSNQSAVPEVISYGGIIKDVSDFNGIKEEILKLKNNNDYRENVIRNGTERLKEFSWEKTINGIRQIILES